ncbi:pentapeptide repeat-containing protein [Amycolatopsis vastitatis]|uniref:pentapeptide repeat-containing protein n=1 Tax=Amycolatopsis vastitatis TaxID=1905142 RepID=UPI00130400FF|nr:pentapeptide repeat-containing protein [Amycolatopsis vastitatis]
MYITNQTLDATRQQNAVTEQGQYTDRFGRAVEQLGSEKADIRLGGIYALERLARDSPRDAGTITNILGGFIRNNARCSTPSSETPKPLLPTDLGAALTVLTRRPASDPPSRDPSVVQADLKGSCLAHLDFRLYDLANVDLSEANLSDANLYGVYMAGVSLTGSNLAGARLTNSVWLGTNITSGNLSDANLTGAALNNTIFAGTNLRRAVLDQTRKDEATPRPTSASSYIDLNQSIKTYAVAPDFYAADLTAASFRYANLPLTTFTGATLDHADFTGAQLPDATFTAAKSLAGTTFNQAA